MTQVRAAVVGLVVGSVIVLGGARLLPEADAQLQQPVVDCATRTLRVYVASGTYERNVREAVARAKEIVDSTPAPNPADDGPKPAIVIDVDDTALSTLAMLDEGDFCMTAELFAKHVFAAKMPAIPPVLEVFNAAKAKGIAVFFITGRGVVYREATVKNLKEQGYDGYAELFLKPAGWTDDGSVYKTMTRKKIEERAFKIVLNLGDQLADMQGGHAEHEVLIPNPFYISR
jgi:predicted secreted acid phosphatase